MRIIKDYGVVVDHGSNVLKLVKTDEGIALAAYKDGMRIREYTFAKDEIKQVYNILCKHLDYKPAKKESKTKIDKDEVVSWLVSTPSSDTNFRSALEKATAEQLDEAIKQVKAKGGRNKTKLTVLEGQKDRLKPTAKAESKPQTEEKKVVAFKSPKPEIIPLPKSDKDATYGECVAKLAKEREMFTDDDSQYVFEGLIELAKVDGDFRNNLMREDKSYGGFMEYMANAVRKGYCINYGNVQWLSRDLGLGLAIDYFNHNEEEEKRIAEEKRKEEEAKRKAEAEKRKKEAKANGKTNSKKKNKTA